MQAGRRAVRKVTSPPGKPTANVPRKQAGVIPFRRQGGRLEVLLVTGRRSGAWIVPKGNMEPDLSAQRSAAKEALEEAGVTGHLEKKPCGSFGYRKNGVMYSVTVFDLEVERVLDEWPEQAQRDRQWFAVRTAATRVHNAHLAMLIRQLPRRITDFSDSARTAQTRNG